MKTFENIYQLRELTEIELNSDKVKYIKKLMRNGLLNRESICKKMKKLNMTRDEKDEIYVYYFELTGKRWIREQWLARNIHEI